MNPGNNGLVRERKQTAAEKSAKEFYEEAFLYVSGPDLKVFEIDVRVPPSQSHWLADGTFRVNWTMTGQKTMAAVNGIIKTLCIKQGHYALEVECLLRGQMKRSGATWTYISVL